MAYTPTTRLVRDGPMDFRIIVEETEVSAADTTTINRNRPNGEAEDVAEEHRIPRKFRLLGVIATLRAGSGTEIAPSFSTSLSVSPAEFTEILKPTAAEQPAAMSAAPVYVVLEGDAGHIKHQTNPDSGADNTVRTVYLCRRHWSDADVEIAGREVVT